MAKIYTVLVPIALFLGGASSLAPSKMPVAKRPAFNFNRAAFNGVAAASLASALVVGPMADAVDVVADVPSFGSTSLIAVRVTREGLYGEYDVDLGDQVYDDARSTFKSAKETKKKKGKYTALIAVLVVGSFIIPMAQYFWYVRDDDSSDRFFSADIPEPEPEPKKKGWFN